MTPQDLRLSIGELGAVAWDWITFTQRTDTVFDFELFQRAYIMYGTQSGALTPQAIGNRSEFCCLLFPTMVLPQHIFGYTNGGMAASQGRRLGLGTVVAERVYVDLSGSFPKTLQSARFDSGYAVIMDSSCESLFVDGEVSSLVFHLDRPSEVLRPIQTREMHTCFCCLEVHRSCHCTVDPTASATAVMQNLWKMSLGPGGTEPSRVDSWHRYVDFLSKISNYCLVDTISSISTTPDAEQLGFVSPVREDISVHIGVVSSGSMVETMKQMFMERLLSQWYPMRRLVDVEALSISGSPPSTGSVASTETTATKAGRNTASCGATCEVCGVEFARPSEKRRHFRTVHLVAREFKCEQCGKFFALRHHLESHVAAVHEGRRDHPCDICGKSFTTEAKAKRHRRCVHEKERLLQCPSCDQAFFQRSDLERHRKRAHPDLPAGLGVQKGLLETLGSDLSAATVETEIGAACGHVVASGSGQSHGRDGCA